MKKGQTCLGDTGHQSPPSQTYNIRWACSRYQQGTQSKSLCSFHYISVFQTYRIKISPCPPTQKGKPTVHIPFNKMKYFPTQNFLNIPFGPNIYVWYQLKRNFLSKHQLHLFFYFCISGSRKPKRCLSLKKIPEASLSPAWIIKMILSFPDENIRRGKKWEENSIGVLNWALANRPERTVCALARDPRTCPRRNKQEKRLINVALVSSSNPSPSAPSLGCWPLLTRASGTAAA